jgi:hypothetical protein
MRIKWEGSLQNRIAERINIKPEIGMGVTEYWWSDREPYEIIAIKDDRHITVRRLDYKRIDNNGISEMQEYEYYSNDKNDTHELFLTKQGVWRERIGRSLGPNKFGIGRAERYYDPTF